MILTLAEIMPDLKEESNCEVSACVAFVSRVVGIYALSLAFQKTSIHQQSKTRRNTAQSQRIGSQPCVFEIAALFLGELSALLLVRLFIQMFIIIWVCALSLLRRSGF